ncbi:MAG: helix-turn-helix domain-containing protein [Planctomycetaceae bacterium]|nr:helix-turn-helix domain-containing protein [Planctomycetaceae bacterium]
MSKRKRFSDQMRNLIETSGQSCYAISKVTGIDQATLSRFLNEKGGMSVEALDTLAEYLGWSITVETKVEPKTRKGK